MKSKMKLSLLAAATLMYASCGTSVEVESDNLTVSMAENPALGAVIDTVVGTSNCPGLTYKISSQDLPGAIQIDSTTGIMTVVDPSLFDFETKPSFVAMIDVAVEDVSEMVLVTINLQDAFDDVRQDALVAHYQMEGDMTDSSTFGNNSSVGETTAVVGVNGRAGSALGFDGVDDIISIANRPQLDLSPSMSISVWVNVNSQRTQTLVRKGAVVNGSGRTPYSLALSAIGDITFRVNDAGALNQYSAVSFGYPVNEWILVTGVLDNGQLKLYVNDAPAETAEGPTTLNTNNSSLLLGSRLGLASDALDGSMDEVRVYNAALTEKEVRELYSNRTFL